MRLPVPQYSYAVLLGSSTYESTTLPDLAAVRNNVLALAGLLTDPDRGGLLIDHCTVLLDPTDLRSVFRTMREYASQASDTFFVYYAGHGRTDNRNELYLTLSDTDPDELRVSALAFDFVRDIFADCRAKNRILVLDCCFSGRAIADMSGADDDVPPATVSIEGSYTLTSTPPNAFALAPPGEPYTAFTGELIDLIRNGAPEESELLTFPVIYRHLLEKMRERRLPNPQQRGTGTVDQLALVRNVAHASSSGRRSSSPAMGLNFTPPVIPAVREEFESRRPIAGGVMAASGVVGLSLETWIAGIEYLNHTLLSLVGWVALSLMVVLTLILLTVGTHECWQRMFTLSVHEWGITRDHRGRASVHLPWAALSAVEIRRLGGALHLIGVPRSETALLNEARRHPLWKDYLHGFMIMDATILRAELNEVTAALERFSGGRYRSIGS